MTGRVAAPRRWLGRVAACTVVLGDAGMLCAGEGQKGFDPGDVGQAVAAMAIFVLLLVVLGKWAWKPIVGQLRQREQEIAETIERAEKREKESQNLLAEYKARLDRAEGDSQEVLARSRKEAAEAREEILTTAREEGQKFADQAKQEIEQAKQTAIHELYDETASLATEMAGRIIRKSLNVEDQRVLLRESLEEIRKNASRNP
jgi:F-type H+-transporting ATPase subunit b